jgi:ubiquitin C-terminal hydrolase
MESGRTNLEASLLQRWFPASLPDTATRSQHGHFSETDLRDIASVLQRVGRDTWARIPRIYTVLRLLNHLEVIDVFIAPGISDVHFPFTIQTLPQSLNPFVAHGFLETQHVVLSNGLDLERESGRHRHFSSAADVPLIKVEELGKGAYGYVDRVISTVSHKEYARKLIPRGRTFQRNKKILRDFERELGTLKKLSHHRHIVQLIGSYTDPTFVGILMSPVAECDLKDFLDRLAVDGNHSSTANKSFARSFFGCLASALSYLHDNTVRHKDIKPQNILVLGHTVYLADFGISLDWSEIGKSTTTGPTPKTARYCAPEVSDYTPRNTSADIWSLGCVFLEIWTVLKGDTVSNLHAFLESNGNLVSLYHLNRDAAFQWMDMLESKPMLADNPPLEWIRHMLIQDKDNRWTARQLASEIEIVNDDPEAKFAFSGQCCMEELESAESVISSNVSTHENDTSEPVPQFSEPVPQFSEPVPQFSEPVLQFSEPVPQFSEPVWQFSEPVPQFSEPVWQFSEPVPQSSEPVPQSSEPVPQSSEPVPQSLPPDTYLPQMQYQPTLRSLVNVGLTNIGNTGWMNASLQCIRNIEELSAYFLQGVHEQDINTTNPIGYGGAIAKAYALLLAELYNEMGNTVVAPRGFKNTIGRMNPIFSGYGQQDAQEFTSFFIDAMQEDLNRIRKKEYIEYPKSDDNTVFNRDAIKLLGSTFRAIYHRRTDSVITDLFNGFYQVNLNCPVCYKTDISFHPYTCFSLEIPSRGPFTLGTCIANTCKTEKLTEENAWFCHHCKENVCAWKALYIWTVPDILMFHLKRFRSRQGKNSVLVDFPVEGLDLRESVGFPEGKGLIYDLFGTINHYQQGPNSGVYTAFAKSVLDQKWYEYNGTRIPCSSVTYAHNRQIPAFANRQMLTTWSHRLRMFFSTAVAQSALWALQRFDILSRHGATDIDGLHIERLSCLY